MMWLILEADVGKKKEVGRNAENSKREKVTIIARKYVHLTWI